MNESRQNLSRLSHPVNITVPRSDPVLQAKEVPFVADVSPIPAMRSATQFSVKVVFTLIFTDYYYYIGGKTLGVKRLAWAKRWLRLRVEKIQQFY